MKKFIGLYEERNWHSRFKKSHIDAIYNINIIKRIFNFIFFNHLSSKIVFELYKLYYLYFLNFFSLVYLPSNINSPLSSYSFSFPCFFSFEYFTSNFYFNLSYLLSYSFPFHFFFHLNIHLQKLKDKYHHILLLNLFYLLIHMLYYYFYHILYLAILNI